MKRHYIILDTSTNSAFVALCTDGQPIACRISRDQKDHARFLHQNLKDLFQETGIGPRELDAVGVTLGPGSYTGLRVGLSTAKGLCYALNKPLITLTTLELLARSVKDNDPGPTSLICPMIDARRMEVFTALYDTSLHMLMPPQALILDAGSFSEYRERGIRLCGNGAPKFAAAYPHPNLLLAHSGDLIPPFARMVMEKWNSSSFSDLRLTDPLYVKEYKAF